jgi:hypothetical protein
MRVKCSRRASAITSISQAIRNQKCVTQLDKSYRETKMRYELQNQEALEAFLRALTLQRKQRLFNDIDTELNRLKGISTQVFRKFEGRLQLVGSAFYLTYQGRLFLISAAHVFDDEPVNRRFIFDENGDLRTVEGGMYKHVTSGRRDDDLKDLIAIEIRNIDTRRELITSINIANPDEDGIYAFMGYPGTKNGFIFRSRALKNRPYAYYDRSLRVRDVTSFSYDGALNVLVRYQRKKSVQKGFRPQHGPKMKGISGGPVFWITPMKDLADWTPDSVWLAGVVIHTVDAQKYMAAAKIGILTEVIDGVSKFQHEFECIEIVNTDDT